MNGHQIASVALPFILCKYAKRAACTSDKWPIRKSKWGAVSCRQQVREMQGASRCLGGMREGAPVKPAWKCQAG